MNKEHNFQNISCFQGHLTVWTKTDWSFKDREERNSFTLLVFFFFVYRRWKEDSEPTTHTTEHEG